MLISGCNTTGRECEEVAEYYADCFGQLETESESSFDGETAIGDSTAVSALAKKGSIDLHGSENNAARQDAHLCPAGQ